jgi:2-aminobenzoate-CoA ligase
MNCASELLGGAIARGQGDRVAIRSTGGLSWTYRELEARANRIAQLLVDDLGVVPGNRVLLRGPNSPMMAACWFAIMKAGAIAVATMPLLRAKELTDIVTKAEASHALCDSRLAEELDLARPACPTLRRVALFETDAADGVEARSAVKPATFADVATLATDTALIAFTSGTTGKPKGTMHSHRDVIAACDCWPKHTLKATPDDVFTEARRSRSRSGWGGCSSSRCGSARRRCWSSGRRRKRCSTWSRSTARPCCSPRRRPTARWRWPARGGTSRACASARRRARRFLPRRASCGRTRPASTSSTGCRPRVPHLISRRRRRLYGSPCRATARACSTTTEGRAGRSVDWRSGADRVPVLGDRQANYVQGGWNLTGDAYLVDDDGWFVYQARTDDMIVSAGYNAGPESSRR